MQDVNYGSNLPTIKIDLSNHSDKFCIDNDELILTKKVNFIFGKNGTGKTTISDEILTQLSADYDVCLFKDFDGVIENNRLNAVALGTENTEIQKKIDTVDSEIEEIINQLKPSESDISGNLFTKATECKKIYDEQDKKISKFLTESARTIKNLSNPQIAKTTYTKSAFEEDIIKAYFLSQDSIDTYRDTIKASEKAKVNEVLFLNIDLLTFLESTNEVLQSKVSQRCDIPELIDNINKQNFAKKGMDIHEQKSGEICAFCGNEISDDRWQLLGNYFNDEVKKLENKIINEIKEIKLKVDEIKNIKEIKEEVFYDKFKKDIENLNLQIVIRKNEYNEFLNNLETALNKKKEDLFIAFLPLKITIPANFSKIEEKYTDLAKNHNELSLNLKIEQEKAKDALRYHEAKNLLDQFNYNNEKEELEKFKVADVVAKEDLEAKEKELQGKHNERKNLILQTKDEEKIAEKINQSLSSMGVISFSLELVEDDEQSQKGQYRIKSYDGSSRSIIELSKGEKNIIAFLYFIFSLESVDRENKLKIIVLDDPMTSNDDTMQYLIIGEIQKLYRELKDGNYFILLTHNCHFYLNVRPDTTKTYEKKGTKINFYEKYGVYHLLSDGKQTAIKNISEGKQDFKTSYETLWKELVFLYNAEDATPDLMLSPCRKICETYMKFMKKGIEAFYGNNINAKKLFDVNQHSIDDFEAEMNGKTKNEIETILCDLFDSNHAKDHFSSHWKGGGL